MVDERLYMWDLFFHGCSSVQPTSTVAPSDPTHTQARESTAAVAGVVVLGGRPDAALQAEQGGQRARFLLFFVGARETVGGRPIAGVAVGSSRAHGNGRRWP